MSIIIIVVFTLGGLSTIAASVIHITMIRPVALKLKGNTNPIRKIFIFSGEELADYWDVEKYARDTNDAKLLNRLRILKYCMLLAPIFLLIFLFLAAANFISDVVLKNAYF